MDDTELSSILDNYYGNKPAPLPEGAAPVDDDGITCNCDHRPKGWRGKLPVALDGDNWPVDFAAKMLGCSEKDLRDLIRITGLEPVGTLKMTPYSRSGRHPRAYSGSKLVKLWNAVTELSRDINVKD